MKNDETIGKMKTVQGLASGADGSNGWDDTLSGAATEGGEGRVVLAGRYKVVKRLGEGGMGSVWLAEDTKLDGRKVAIKMLPAVLAGKKGAYRQVKQEALMAMKLSHPNIATVRAFEEDEGGVPFLVMDYVEGTGLDEMLAEKGGLSEEETVRLLGPVASALDYAHGKGVVHRDVKPGNVMVAKDGTPYVLDFGIAREIQETMTRVTGKFASGTLLYMSPEQLHGRAPKAVQDVYSFAAMAYECLTGTPPFSRGQIEYQIDHDEPEPLAESMAGRALREGIMAGLAKEPGQRPETCAGVLGGIAKRNGSESRGPNSAGKQTPKASIPATPEGNGAPRISATRVSDSATMQTPEVSVPRIPEEDGARRISPVEELSVSGWYYFRIWIAWNIDSKGACIFYVVLMGMFLHFMEPETVTLVAAWALPLLIVGLYFVFKYISRLLLKPVNKQRRIQDPNAPELSVKPGDCRKGFAITLLCYGLLYGAAFLVGYLLEKNGAAAEQRVLVGLVWTLVGSAISYLLFRRLVLEMLLASVRKQIPATNGNTSNP